MITAGAANSMVEEHLFEENLKKYYYGSKKPSIDLFVNSKKAIFTAKAR